MSFHRGCIQIPIGYANTASTQIQFIFRKVEFSRILSHITASFLKVNMQNNIKTLQIILAQKKIL